MATVFINEFHYLNAGVDTNSFVEIAGPAGTDLTNYSIVAYRTDGTIFQQKFLSGIIPIQYRTALVQFPLTLMMVFQH